MDRVAPSRRPPGRNAGTQRWRDLLFLHWEVDPQQLRPLVPAQLELDLFEGRAFVGVVPFLMRSIRPSWWPGPAFDFYETNLRTYVQRGGDEPGVYFFSLEASSWLAVQAARKGWGLPYHHARMSGADNEGRVAPGDELAYQSSRRDGRADFRVRCRVGEALPAPQLGGLEHFLLERYYLYNVRGGTLQRGTVHHVPYPAHDAVVLDVRDGLLAAAGLSGIGARAPDIAHYSPGVDVEVFSVGPV